MVPLTCLLKGGKMKLKWNLQATDAFHELKERFTSAPVHEHTDAKHPFVVEVDVSDPGIGAFLLKD